MSTEVAGRWHCRLVPARQERDIVLGHVVGTMWQTARPRTPLSWDEGKEMAPHATVAAALSGRRWISPET